MRPIASCSTARSTRRGVGAAVPQLPLLAGRPHRSAGHGFMFFPGANSRSPTRTRPTRSPARATASSRAAPRATAARRSSTLNSGTEYWQAGQSLVTTDPLGQRDDDAARQRAHLVDELDRASGVNLGDAQGRVRDALQSDRLSAADARRAGRARSLGQGRYARPGKPLSAHRRWHAGALGEAQSRHSRARDGEGPNQQPRLDYGPDIAKGIVGNALPVALKDRYRVLVPKVDADGNETAASPCPTSRCRPAPRWAGRCVANSAGGAGELCYLEARSSRSPGPRRSVRPRSDRGPRSTSATATTPTIPNA